MTTLKNFCDAIAGEEFLVLDTETTGLDDGEIVQIAIVHSSGQTLLDTLVKPAKLIPADATRIHGITEDMVKNAPTWPELTENLKALLDGKNVVIYNAVYDRKMMHKSQERHGLDKIEWKEIATFHCAMEAFAEFYGDWNEYRGNYRWQKLVTAARHFGVKVENAHNALGDCLMTLGVVNAMLKDHEAKQDAFIDAYGNKDISEDLGLDDGDYDQVESDDETN